MLVDLWMAENVSADHNKNGRGGYRERLQDEESNTEPCPLESPWFLLSMGISAASTEDRDCGTVK